MNTIITIEDSQGTACSAHRTLDPAIAIERAISKRYGQGRAFQENGGSHFYRSGRVAGVGEVFIGIIRERN